MLKLDQIVEFMDMIRGSPYGEYQIWINLKTDETEVYNELFTPSEEREEFRHDNAPEWILFRPEIYDSNIIESFIATVNDGGLRDLMHDIFQGRGKYRRIKTYFARSGFLDRFYRYETEYVRNAAIEWCKTSGVPFRE